MSVFLPGVIKRSGRKVEFRKFDIHSKLSKLDNFLIPKIALKNSKNIFIRVNYVLGLKLSISKLL